LIPRPIPLRRPSRRGINALLALAGAIAWTLCPGPTEGRDSERETPVVRAVRKVAPAVVNISSTQEIRSRPHPFGDFPMDPFFEQFFNDFFEAERRRGSRSSTSLGSGVIIDGEKGYLLTNAHVVEKAGAITVTLKDQRVIEAEIIGIDSLLDLAVLRIRSEASLPSVEMGSSEDLMIGETVIAIGNPFGFSHTVTTGVISALNRGVRTADREFHEFIQIDASINPGNSGGPLLNIRGELIGINTAIYTKGQGIGFAIPIDKARRVVSDLIRYGEVVDPWIGLWVANLPRMRSDPPDSPGVGVKGVFPGSTSDRAGVRSGDRISAIGDSTLRDAHEYRAVFRSFRAGDRLELRLVRSGREMKVPVIPADFPLDRAEDIGEYLMGIRLAAPPPAEKGPREGLIITEIRKDSRLRAIGARKGDLLRRINDVSLRTLPDYRKAVSRYYLRESVVILLQRGEQGYFINLEL